MIESPIPQNEAARQQAVDDSHIIDTLPEERFDRLTRLARRLFNVEISAVSFSDHRRQWIKSAVGIESLDVKESPRSTSFCGHVVASGRPIVIEDSFQDTRFFDNPYVTGDPFVRFYAGVPLFYEEQALGTFCLACSKPRKFSNDDLEVLADFAKLAEDEIVTIQHAIVCPLTGLLNRRGLMQLGSQIYKICRRQFTPLTCLFFDLNGLKTINDSLGHDAGDAAIIGFAECLKSITRSSDVCSRLGGDEYVLLMAKSTEEGAREFCNRLDGAIEEFNSRETRFALRYSVGAATLSPKQSLDDLINEADAAMYADKRHRKEGRDRVVAAAG